MENHWVFLNSGRLSIHRWIVKPFRVELCMCWEVESVFSPLWTSKRNACAIHHLSTYLRSIPFYSENIFPKRRRGLWEFSIWPHLCQCKTILTTRAQWVWVLGKAQTLYTGALTCLLAICKLAPPINRKNGSSISPKYAVIRFTLN